MRYIRIIAAAFLAALIWPVAAAISAIERFVFPAYQPDAATSLALDGITRRDDRATVLRSRFRAFVDRARTHAAFTAGHFDPGRMAA